jgi:chloramphenicol-sensitive protein RarD
VPLFFQLLGHMGASPWEILAQRIVWGAPAGVLFVLWARQGRTALSLFRKPKTLGWLALSAGLIAANWSAFIWAVNSGRVLETSLGYYVLPLLNMAAGAALFGERIDRAGLAAVALAAAGVVLQTAALGRLPIVALFLALTFGGYGIVRKHAPAEAQTGFLIECLLLFLPALAFVFWLQDHGRGSFGHGGSVTWLLVACGPVTAAPLVLFAWAARRVPLSALGFLQFISPTITFGIGVLQGEPLGALRAASFVLIWAGVAVYALAAWGRLRRSLSAAPEGAAAE